MKFDWMRLGMLGSGVLAAGAGFAAVRGGMEPDSLWGVGSGVLTALSAFVTAILLFVEPFTSKDGRRALLERDEFLVIVTTLLSLVAFVFLLRFLPEFFAWTGWSACGDCTIQGWVSATSGWVGAGVGAVAAIAVFRQLRETKLQTAFTVGDALPTMDAIEHISNFSELVVRIVNWNRRTVVLRDLQVSKDGIIILSKKTTVDGKSLPGDAVTLGVPTFAIKGWEDRSKPPHHAEIRLVAYLHGNLSQVQSWESLPRIQATVQLLGNSHKLLNLTADTRPITR